MNAAQRVAVVAWSSVVIAPWVAWLTATPLRSPHFVAVVATAAIIGLSAGLHHQGQVEAGKGAALDAIARRMAEVLDLSAESQRRAGEWQGRYREAAQRVAQLERELGRPNVREPFIERVPAAGGEADAAG